MVRSSANSLELSMLRLLLHHFALRGLFGRVTPARVFSSGKKETTPLIYGSVVFSRPGFEGGGAFSSRSADEGGDGRIQRHPQKQNPS